MKEIKLSEIFGLFGQRPPFEGTVREISTDTRTIREGSLFVPVKGERFDGHKFIEAAFEKGAAAALCEESEAETVPEGLRDRIVVTGDTLDAMLKIAAWYRSSLSLPITAVTGSNGKTTTKDMLVHLLSGRFRTAGTKANFNNEIGVPATIFSFDDETERAVVEMGMRGAGQIRRLARAVRPTSSIITMIGEAHFELLGSRRAIAEAKSEINELLPEDGFAVMNGDDEFADFIRERCPARTLFFGRSDRCDMRLLSCRPCGGGSLAMLSYGGETAEAFVPLAGAHNVSNAMAAALSAVESGVPFAEAAERLGSVEITGGRTEVIRAGGRTIVNDCYNSSPSSLSAALDAFSGMGGPRVAIIGDMLELGEISGKAHYESGVKAAKSGIDLLLTAGEEARKVRDGAIDSGMPPERCVHFGSPDDFPDYAGLIPEECSILVKASHSMRFEKITEYLKSSK